MHHGCVRSSNEGGREAAGWWPTSPSSRWGGRTTTPAGEVDLDQALLALDLAKIALLFQRPQMRVHARW
jgi:hypothetical protein